MYRKLTALLLFCNLWYSYGYTETDNNVACASFIPIPDPNFEIALFNLGIDDMPGDGQVPMGMVMITTDLNVSNQFIADLSGIEHFAALQTLNVSGNNLTNLNLNGLPQLTHLYANDNMLNILDLSNNQSLQYIQADNNNLFQINIQNLSALLEVSLNNNNLSMLEIFNSMNLETLRVTNNMLMTLEVSALTNLKTLDVNENSLQSISLEPLVNLENLVISNNQLSTINLGFNTALINFDASSNQLTSIDLTMNTALSTIQLSNNNLTSANLRNGNNTNISSVNLTSNTGLTCVFVDDTAYSTSNWTSIDTQTLFTSTEYCRYTIIPDINFETTLEALGYDDMSSDGQVPTALIENVTALNLSSTGTANLSGIQDFAALESFELNGETIPTVDLSANTQLKTVEFNDSTINTFLVDNNPLLETIEFDSSDEQSVITNLNLSNSPSLRELDANSIGLVNLTLPNDIQNLEKVFLEGNNFESLDLSGATSLTRILLGNSTDLNYLNLKNGNNTNVTLINLLNTPNLTCALVDDATYSTTNWTVVDNQISFSDTYCRYTTIPDANFELRLGTLGYDDIATDGQVPTALIENAQSILIANLAITDLTGIEDFTALQTLEADFNNLTTIDLSNNLNLTYLNVNRNGLTNLDLTANTSLVTVIVTENELTELDIRSGSNTNIFVFNARNNPNLNCIFVDDAAYSASNWTQIDAHTQFSATGYCRYTSIPDSNFEAALNTLGYDDIAGDQQVPTALIEVVTSLDVNSKSITNMTGIQDFIALTELEAANNPFSTINVSTLTDLEILNLDSCPITSLDVSSNLQLKNLDVEDGGNLNSLDLTTNTLLEVLDANDASLSSITFGNLTSLKNLYLNSNQLQSLDLSALVALEEVFLRNNALTYLNVKNGNNTAILSGNFDTTQNPDLSCIVVDDVAYSTAYWTAIELNTSFSDTYCRYTAIPDSNFEAALNALGYDDIPDDGQVPTTLIENELVLDVRNASIADLTGIEDFTALRSLRLTNNSLTSIDLSQNLNLDFLWCDKNSLTSLDLSNNTGVRFIAASENAITSFDATGLSELTNLSIWTNQLSSINLTDAVALRELDLFGNSLTELDVSENVLLKEIGIRNNSISSLDLTNNPALTSVDVRDNGMTHLNVKNGFNTNITNFRANSNSNLTCIRVDDAAYSTTNWTNIDAQTSFSDTYCRYTVIPDPNFEAYLDSLGYDDSTADGQVPTALIEVLTSFTILPGNTISDITGIEAFTALEELRINQNNITSVNVDANTALTLLEINSNPVTSVSVNNNPVLDAILILNTETTIASLDLSNSPLLRDIDITNAGLQSIVLPELPNLEKIFMPNNNLTASLDLSASTLIQRVALQGNNLLDFNMKNGNNTNILSIFLQNNPNLTCVLVDDVNYSTTNWTGIDAQTSFSDTYCRYTAIPDANFEAALETLGYDDMSSDGQVPTLLIEGITSLDIQNQAIADLTGIEAFTALTDLQANNNLFSTVNLHTNSALEILNLSNCPLTELDLSSLVNLLEIDLVNNNLTSLDLSNNTALLSLVSTGNSIVSYDLRNNTALNELVVVSNVAEFINIKNGNNTNISGHSIYGSPSLCVSVDDVQYAISNWSNVQSSSIFTDSYCRYTQIPDASFEAQLTSRGYDDIPDDGQVPTLLIESITTLVLNNDNISDVTGIEDFAALTRLSLKENDFTTIDLSQNTLLESINFEESDVISINISNNLLLRSIDCNQSDLANIDISNVPLLKYLDVSGTEVANLDTSNTPLLSNLDVSGTLISVLDVSNNPLLTSIRINGTDIESLDLSVCTSLIEFSAFNAINLMFLNMKNGNNTNVIDFDTRNCNVLGCVLVDDAVYSTTNWTQIEAVTSFSDTYCRYTAIPDAIFESELGALTYDDIPDDGQVPTALIENVISLDVGGAGIADITGIEAFVSLEDLNVESNSFTNIDVSNLTKLKELRLSNCPITSIDVSTNILLEDLFLENAVNLGVLDLSTNTQLINLDATNCGITAITFTTHDNLLSIVVPQNELTNLDVSSFSALAGIEVNDNNLNFLNVKNGNNGNLEIIDFTNNPNLTCILVDDAANANANWSSFKDVTATYNDVSCTNDFSLDIRVYLQGAALNRNAGEQNLMRDDLRMAGYLPTTSPYADAITCEATVFDVTGANAIVDWIWIELRDPTNNTIVSYARSALLQRDGDVVEIDGVSTLNFSNLEDTYYVAVNHRSHLGIMTANAITFTIGATNSVNFASFGDSSLFGSNARTTFGMPTEIYGMWCGNANGDTVIQYSGTSPDTPNILSEVLNDPGNFLNFPTYSVTGYNTNDANMDGVIQYSGTNPDTPFILQNVLAHPGNFL
ncbi:MAG: hypothetical protein ACRBBL_24225, partial [Kordia sp.]